MAAPLRVWQRLSDAADGPRGVVHSGRDAVYVDLDGSCVGLVSSAATRVPCALWSGLRDLRSAGITGTRAEVSGGGLVLDGVGVQVARLVDVRVPTLEAGRHGVWSSARPHPMTSGPELPADGRLTPADVHRLVGRGPGLTPLGDDVLAGWLATRVAAGAPDRAVAAAVRGALGATTSLSATLLECALHGEALPELRAWLTADDAAAQEDAATGLLGVGATSGAGLLAGARLALLSLGGSVHQPGRVA